ncbi:hypothetical protein BD410DRAFT_808936 [Rickenella mellea]|uniref:Uncharacterized protein n=1 Tax=Rickenella mellea TaxID=50990 RepID=A0A4Y7PJ47_9AGAM|nr:hypothetical protein BD410DRAFT_808936 [Rickenella mellea]
MLPYTTEYTLTMISLSKKVFFAVLSSVRLCLPTSNLTRILVIWSTDAELLCARQGGDARELTCAMYQQLTGIQTPSAQIILDAAPDAALGNRIATGPTCAAHNDLITGPCHGAGIGLTSRHLQVDIPFKTWFVYMRMHAEPGMCHFPIILCDTLQDDLTAQCSSFAYPCVCLDHNATGLEHMFVPVGLTGKKSDFDHIVGLKYADPPEWKQISEEAKPSYRCLLHFQAKLKDLRAKGVIIWDEQNLRRVISHILDRDAPKLPHCDTSELKLILDNLKANGENRK